MGFIATKKDNGFENPPAGTHLARCYGIIDLGTQDKKYQGKVIGRGRKIRVMWELLGDDRMADGRPFTQSKNYSLSMHEKAALRIHLESWRGRAFTAEDEESFDVSKLLGAYCMLNLVEDADYVNIAAIMPMPKGMVKPSPVNENIVFDLDDPNMDQFEKFGQKTKEIIMSSPEWKEKRVAEVANGFDSDINF